MRPQRPVSPIVALGLAAVLTLAASCNTSPTNAPPPPGGGGTVKELDSGNIPNGGVYSHTFAGAGTFHYHCTIHGTGMAGQVIVVNGAADSALVTIANNTYTPDVASVRPGGSVRWINSGSTHTVTSN